MLIKRSKPTHDIPSRRRAVDNTVERSAGNTSSMFQRNRTLTGSTSETVGSYAHPADLKSPRTHAHHLKVTRRKVGSYLGISVLAAAALLLLLLQLTANVSVSTQDTTITKPLKSLEYTAVIEDYLSANPIMRLRFALDPVGLEAYMQQALPEIDRIVTIQMGEVGDTNFSVALRKPVASWTISAKKYYVDAKGIAFEQNYYAEPSVQIIDESGAQLEQGATIASNRLLGFVGRVVSDARKYNFTVTQATLPQDTTRQLDIRISESSSIIKFSIDRSAGEQVEDMSRALVYLQGKGRSPGYVDIRVSGKAFYL